MKQLLSKLCDHAKQLLSKFCDHVKQLLSSEKCRSLMDSFTAKICNCKEQLLSAASCERVKKFFSSKLSKLLVLIFVLMLVLIISLSRCSRNQESPTEPVVGNVGIEVLNVYKKTAASSRILGQLPLNLEVEILEEKVVKGTTWGRIDQINLPDGTVVDGGWIDMHYIDFSGDEEFLEDEYVEEDTQEVNSVVVNMGTITASKLNIRKGPGSTYEADGAYHQGDRVEILETQTVDDTLWGRTTQGWIGMGYVRMDGTSVPSSTITESATTSMVTTDGNSTVLGYGIITIGELNVRRGPDTIYATLRKVTSNNRYAYYELLNGWVRIEDGWISADHFYIEGTVTDSAFTGAATTDNLKIRTGPSTNFGINDTLSQGDVVDVLTQIDKWGYTENGWVYLSYLERVIPDYNTGTGIVNRGLNIRAEANADSEIVGTYTTGDFVEILEVAGGWGRTDRGWINLKYVNYNT